ncbi:hypothetical protein [Spirosoma sp. KCTC 42546]|nr:hypothetical protein [Spirosoma sp. KCTC 42546]
MSRFCRTFDYSHLFVTKQQAMHDQFATLKNHLKNTGGFSSTGSLGN